MIKLVEPVTTSDGMDAFEALEKQFSKTINSGAKAIAFRVGSNIIDAETVRAAGRETIKRLYESMFLGEKNG